MGLSPTRGGEVGHVGSVAASAMDHIILSLSVLLLVP